MRSIAAFTCAVFSAVALQLSTAELLKSMSFSKPFEEISSEGDRLVSSNWDMGGSTTVNRHFVRLTPDRQSRKGYVWSKERLARRDFSLVLTFRISGQAQSWYGDGLALWVTTAPFYQAGDNHGFTPQFRGMGFVFDTFINQEHAGGHKDITFFENDGTKTLDELNDQEKVGCMASGIRYYEKNAGFSPSLNMSRVKIQYKDNFVQISVDPRNTGEWQECLRKQVSMPEEWIQDATIGLTASTGGLADNHDVISLSVYDDVIDTSHATGDEKVKNQTKHDLDESLNDGDADAKLRLLKRKYEQLLEDFDHQFTALKESTENTIKKLREQEADDAQRIQELEQWADGQVTDKVSESLFEVKDQVTAKLKQTVEESAKKSSGWKTPFFILLLVLGGAVAAGYKKYQDLRKSHLL